ncbi:MAG: phosphodiesterase/alkaline phosphatase D-like protein [Akkermansiaceae bacterium]|jgi:phosphodiesterase/alkaline phosphatase D-like protein
MKRTVLYFTLVASLQATPIPLINPGGELNNGVDRTLVSDPSVLGWEGTGQVINDRTDYGNGGWRLTFEDSGDLHQLTTHPIEERASYSLRFDAAIFSGTPPDGDFTLIGPGLKNGDFNADTSTIDGRNFEETPNWFNLGTSSQTIQATRFNPPNTSLDGSRNAVLAANDQRRYANDPGHTLVEGDLFQVSYQWRDAFNWNDTTNRIRVTLFTTDDDLITGTPSTIQFLDSDLSTTNNTYETQTSLFSPIPAPAAGRKLFASFEAINGGNGFARLENFTLQRGTSSGTPVIRNLIADLYVDNGGTPEIITTRTYDFKSSTLGSWHHSHLAVPPAMLAPHAGKLLGIRFRSTPSAAANFQSIDNVRLDSWSATSPTGDFSHDWNATPDQVWPGPGYWGNRLHDWEVRNNRVNCILGSRDRRTLHKVDTTLRGNGQNFSLSARTGLHDGTNSSAARSGFLLGAGPGLDWRGALLVHDGLGRDFGIFVGLRGDGAAIIEDLTAGTTNALALGTAPAAFPTDARLNLTATYLPISGKYQLALSALSPNNTLLSTATAEVASAQLLGSLGLLSHKGSNEARFWFDDFSGTGPALNPEPDRHLAILGAMYTLSRQTLKLTAQLPPLDLASTPPVTLETRDGDTWNEIASTAIDKTDSLSSYTATFKIPAWDDTRDTDFRITVKIDNAPYQWTGTIRKNPVDQSQITLAATTCQRIADGSIQNNGFDWSPVKLWQPNTLAFRHILKQNPDVFLALGDQIYEGQPTPEDSGTDFNRHHDYLYKWYLWVLQARDVTRIMPTICIPDDHDVYQGNLWGEGGISTNSQNSGGYEEPATWVKMLERTQTSHLPDTDPYNPVQPAPPVAQGIPTYFTGMIYGDIGFAILEDRKFKTGKDNPPADLNQQFLLGTRQKNFLRSWAHDWDDQTVKCLISQSPFGNIHTHANSGYGFGLNDKDTHGWPTHRRNETWKLLRKTRMFQIAGDQHLATFAHHGIDGPADAGFSYTAPAIGNFFPRAWDPIHNSAGRIDLVNPYKGDFFFDGNGTLPEGQANLTSSFPHHVRVLGAGNPHQYHNQTRNISPANLHDRGAGYGLIRIEKNTRQITFETWPLHANPDHPNTGSQFPDWPITISQTDNDGRTPTGYLPLIDSGYQAAPVISVYHESTGELVYSIRTRDNLVRPPVYDNTITYRIVIEGGTILTKQTPLLPEPPAINSFRALKPRISPGATTTLRWDATGAETVTIDGQNVLPLTVNGIGFLQVSPTSDTTYTLTLNGSTTATTKVLVLDQPDPAPSISSAVKNPDASFTSLIPLDTRSENFVIEQSPDLVTWTEIGGENTTREITGVNLTLTLTPFYVPSSPTNFYRARWRQ